MLTVSPLRLRVARSLAGMDQEQLGQRAGVSQPTISGWECGRHTPRPFYVGRLAQALGVSVADLCVPEEDEELVAVLASLDESRRRHAGAGVLCETVAA
ncbi:helix-turn-helix transcriptional regulator [Streptomyces sp. NPDC006458]|uniref:helix-turn-helix domain-containing protein n=1 Tax=Streptomyces TaxID=1883 RepID=UPI0033B73AEF